jgi:phosphopantetheinyl transferase (holo-ACP synthase)
VNPAWADALKVEEPTEAEYYQALAKGLAKNAKQERVLRILAWRRRNDIFRDKPLKEAQGISDGPEEWRKNLEALARLLTEEDVNDCLMKAEVLRELGEFESAKEALSRATSTDSAAVVRQLRSLCNARDTSVRELHSSPPRITLAQAFAGILSKIGLRR